MAKGERPGFSFLICPDSELLREKLDALTGAWPGQWERHVFWGDEEPEAGFWDKLTQQGLFAASRLVIVRRAQDWSAGVWKGVSQSLSGARDNVWPIFCLEVEQEKGKFKVPAHIQKLKCMAFAEKMGWVWSQPALAGANLQNYVQKHAARLGLQMSAEAMAVFCANVLPSARTIINELEKLKLASRDGKVDAAMANVDSCNMESNAFACLQELEKGNLPGAWREVSRANASNLLFFLIALVARELRLFWQLLTGAQPYLRPAEASFKKNLARSVGFAGAARGFAALADAEYQVKSGRQSPEQTLEQLCVRLAEIFCPHKAAG